MNKSEIRKKILRIRKQKSFQSSGINFKDLSNILKRIKISGKVVGGYYPYNYEFDTLQILEQLEKLEYQISLPKIKKNSRMDFFYWSFKDPLSINKYGIPEPTSNRVVIPSIIIVPIVAFDKDFNRIGYGGGFYDRYIKRIKKIKKIITIGLGYSFQKIKKIPTNRYDMKLDFILTEKN